MTGRSDEVEQGVDSVVSETRITLDSRFFGQNVVVLSLEIADDFAKGRLVVDLISEARGINYGQRNPRTLFVNLKL